MPGSRRFLGRARLLAALLLVSAALAGGAAAAPLPDPRFGQSVALLPSGKILVVGGTDGSGPTASAEILDATHGSEFVTPQAVSAAASMNFARSSATITVLPNGNVLVTGGWDGANARGDAEVYNPSGNSWTVVTGMQSGRFNHTATLLLTGNVLVCGGQTGAADVVTAACDLFAPSGASGSFSPTGSLLLGRQLHSATLLTDGTVWIAGGWNSNGALNANPPYVVTTERYSAAAGTWQQAAPLNASRAFHTATLTGDNKVLVAGGIDNNISSDTIKAVDKTLPAPSLRALSFPRFGVLNSSELFDPNGGAIVQGPPIQARVEGHAAALLPSGIVSMFGGRGNIPPTNVASFPAAPVFTAGSNVTGSFTGVYSSHVITGGAGTVPLTFYLGTPVSGSVLDGDVEFINPKVSLNGSTVSFVSNLNAGTGLHASLVGAKVGCDASGVCGYVSASFPLAGMQGTYSLMVPVAGANNLGGQAVSGSLTFNPTPMHPNVNSGVATVTGGNFTTHIQITVPSFLTQALGSQVSSVTLTLGPDATASWTEASSYTVTLNGGSGLAAGPFPVITSAGVSYIDIPSFTFNNVAGSLTLIPTDPAYTINSGFTVPLAVSAKTNALGYSMQYAATGIDLGGQTLTFDSADLVVRDMIYGDYEFFTPNSSQWSFQPPGITVTRPALPRVGASSLITPSGSEFDIGGRECSGGCASLIPAADGSGGSRADLALEWTPSATQASATDPLSHAFHTSTLLPDGTVLVAGGTDGSVVLNAAEIFSPSSLAFTPTATPMTSPRQQQSASLLPNGRVLLAGGFTTAPSSGPTNSAEIYYPDTKVFLAAPPMISSRSQHVAITLPNGDVFVAGGFNGLNTVTGSAEIYSSTSVAWTAAAAMTTLGANAKRAIAAAVQLQDGRIMLCGGTNETGILNTAIAYNPATNSWSNLASMPASLRDHTATLLFDGRVLVAGGDNGVGETTSSFIYDPVGNSWSSAGALNNARFGHDATLLPNGTVLVTGGVQQSGTANAIKTMEYFIPDSESWDDTNGADVMTSGARAYHTATLAPNGQMYFIGGVNGSIGAGGGSATFYKAVDSTYFTQSPDQFSNSTPSLRQSTITAVTPAGPILPAASLTVAGVRFRGGTEAGGGAGSANASFSTPRLMLQKVDGSNGAGSGSSPGFVADLTQQIYANPANLSTLNTRLTVTLPNNNALPYGWYLAWVGDTDIHTSLAPFVQVGPPKPATTVVGLSGTVLGVSSITYTWTTGISGIDGYDIYSATNGVFIATAPASAAGFTQTGLTAGAPNGILVAGYTMSGDGPLANSGTYYTLARPVILSVTGTPVSPTAIQWNWTANGNPISYQVVNSTSGELLASPTKTSFLDTGLAVNSQRSIMVSAVSSGGQSPLSAAASAYTMAAVPGPTAFPLSGQTTGSFTLTWSSNGNPPGTVYNVSVLEPIVSTTTPVFTGHTTNLILGIPGLSPNQLYACSVSASNTDGSATTAPLVLASSYTLAAQPAGLQILGTTPVSITATWSKNGNSTFTVYQVTYSNDDFVANVATAVPFSAGLQNSTVAISGLLTSTTYWVQVQALNGGGQTSSPSTIVSTITFNGGVALGSFAGVLTSAGGSQFSGSLGDGTFITLRSPGGAFPADTTVAISTYDTAGTGHGALCPNGIVNAPGGQATAFSITDSPAFQPARPLFLTVSYSPAEITSPLSQVALSRFDPASGTCVPLQTSFNTAARTYLAELNHFSLYQLVAVPLAASADTARVFPNPYRPASDGYVTIDQIPPASRVRIFTLRGERILDASANGIGNVTWAGDNSAGRPVASGLYLVVVESGGTKKIQKLAVIR